MDDLAAVLYNYAGSYTINGPVFALIALDMGTYTCLLYTSCYMDGVYSPTCEVPMVGAADYPLGNAARFTWFLTTDYTSHF